MQRFILIILTVCQAYISKCVSNRKKRQQINTFRLMEPTGSMKRNSHVHPSGLMNQEAGPTDI